MTCNRESNSPPLSSLRDEYSLYKNVHIEEYTLTYKLSLDQVFVNAMYIYFSINYDVEKTE